MVSVVQFQQQSVALRKESVDRNTMQQIVLPKFAAVALRKESVDRNVSASAAACLALSSLSARRAWIEIYAHTPDRRAAAGRSPQGERG